MEKSWFATQPPTPSWTAKLCCTGCTFSTTWTQHRHSHTQMQIEYGWKKDANADITRFLYHQMLSSNASSSTLEPRLDWRENFPLLECSRVFYNVVVILLSPWLCSKTRNTFLVQRVHLSITLVWDVVEEAIRVDPELMLHEVRDN
jgi:hypothetical protein